MTGRKGMLRKLAGHVQPSKPNATDRPRLSMRLSHRIRQGLTGILATAIMFTSMPPMPAEAGTRTLSFKQMHTGERLTVTYKRNGRFVPDTMKKINYMLRDWRRNESIKMNPKLIDLVWELQHKMGAKEPIHVLSGYRSPVTNAALRRRGRGVARKSQHTVGNALDFYIPGVNLAKMRATAMRMQRGGVGFYPRSGSPFMHVDTANVRAWPRMTRQQLVRVFPDGETLHLPSNGRPLKGYQRAKAKARQGRLAIFVDAEDGAVPSNAQSFAEAAPDSAASTSSPSSGQRTASVTLPQSAPVPPVKPTGVALYAALGKPVPAPPVVQPVQGQTTQLADAGIPTAPQPPVDTRQDAVMRQQPLQVENRPLALASASPPLPPNRPLPPAPRSVGGDQIAQQIGAGNSVTALAAAGAPQPAAFAQFGPGTAPGQMMNPVLPMLTRAWSLFSDPGSVRVDDSGVSQLDGLTQPPAYVLTHNFVGPAVVRVGPTPFAGAAIQAQPFHRVAFTSQPGGQPGTQPLGFAQTASIR
jgi:uncharacterized protein YcbK (DUF882 family)